MNKLNDFWSNRKVRAIIFIVFYIILFSYIFIVYGNRTEKVIMPETKPVKEEKKIYNSYEYEYKTGEEIINVTKYNDIVSFKIDEVIYYYINGKTYKLEEEKLHEVDNPLKYNFDYLNNIEELKKLSNLVKTTKYVDGLVEENYDVNLNQTLNLFNQSEEVDNKMCNYSIFYNEKIITKIVFNDLNIEIKYTNLDEVNEIKINYEFNESEV